MLRTASCLCGRLTASCGGEPVRNSVCHCLACKRRSGSAFAWGATYEADRVTTSGAFSTFTRTPDAGYWARFHFCPGCGVTLFYEIERRPGLVTIPAGTFADPDFPAPTFSVYEERQCSWYTVEAAERMF